jgi:hypothetical protein
MGKNQTRPSCWVNLDITGPHLRALSETRYTIPQLLTNKVLKNYFETAGWNGGPHGRT